MKWKKTGKIFEPQKYKLTNDCIDYAQSPQALVFDDFVRIYFSSRKRAKDGKYLSYIHFIDMDKSFKEIINISTNTVIELGKLGCFDEHGIFPMNIVRHNNKILAYTSGWTRRVSVSADSGIGLAISYDNGLTFKRIGDGPVLTSSLHEPFLVADPFVIVHKNVFHMWYIYGTSWKPIAEGMPADRTYKIGHATSNDGILWQKEGRQLIADKYADECQALPTVINISGKFHMFFCYRQSFDFRNNREKGYRIGYAYSDDMINWIRDDTKVGIDVTEGSWDSDMLCYPHVFKCNDKIYMLYNGNEFGKYGFGLAQLEE